MRKRLTDCPHKRPPGWRISAKAVRRFIIGDEALGVSRKFYGDDALVDRAIVTLISAQGLMLVGEPGTAKSMLSELLAAAISGTSDLVVQGSAGTTEDHVRYSWNYALLLAQGPSEAALVPSPVLSAMRNSESSRLHVASERFSFSLARRYSSIVSVVSRETLMCPR